MATLTGKKISESYKDLLQVSNSNAGVDGTLRDVEDGEGTTSVLQISSSSINIKDDGALQINETAITSTAAEINVLDGYTGSVVELNYLDTLHATGVTATEFDYLDGVTSSIQTQIDSKISAFRTVEVDTNGDDSANETLGASETLRFKKGNNVTLSESGGVITIASTDTNTQLSNAQVRTAVEAATDSNVFTDADHSKLNAIEASADVTDTANVTAAGALMDSELTSIADVKALDQSVVSGASPTFGTANMSDASNKRFMTDAQETKLDSVESNATADQTASDIRALGFFDTSNDGATSGLDSDLLDGQHGSYYLDFGNFVIDDDEIPIAKLASDSVSYGGVSVTLGASDSTPAFNLSDATGLPIVAGTTGTLSIARGGTGQTSLDNFIELGAMTVGNYAGSVAGTTNEIEVTGSAGEGTNFTIGLPDDVVIANSLVVNGTTTTIDTTNLIVEDPLIKLAKANNAADSVDIGFYGLYDTSGSQDLYAGLFRDANDSGKFKLFKDLQVEPTTTVNVAGTGYTVGTLVSDLEGNVTGNVTGNAGTATKLATARDITLTGDITGVTPGAGFDGSADVSIDATIAANAVEGSMLNTNVISGQTNMTGDVADADELMISDAGTLKRIDFSVFRDAIFNDVSGDATVASGGALTIAADSVALGTDTTGNYVATVADSGTGGITVANSGSESAAVTVELDINGLTAATLASGDFLAFSDESATGDPTKKESIDDIATLFAGTGLTASSAVINLDISGLDLIAEAALTEASDTMLVYDADAGAHKRITIEDLEDAIGGTGTVTNVVAGTGLSGGGTTTATLDLDFSELTDMTGDISGSTEFILQDGTTESRKAASEIKLSNFNNDSGFVTANTMGSGFVLEDGDGTEVTITENKEVKFIDGTGMQINWSNTSNGTDADPYDLTFELDVDGLTLLNEAPADADTFIVYDDSASSIKKVPASEVGSDTTYSAGSGLDLSSTTFSVDVSDFMTNGSNNRILTATGTDAMNAESRLFFDGSHYLDINSIDDAEGGLRFSKSATDATHTKYHISHRDDNQTLLFYSYDGTTYRNWITLDEPNALLKLGSNSSALCDIDTSGNFKVFSHLELPYGEINDAGTDMNIVSTNALTLGTESGTALTFANASLRGVFADDVSIPVAKKLYFGGGDHTYIGEDVDDRLRFFTGGAEYMRFTETGSGILGIYRDVYMGDSLKIHLGASNDLEIYHDGTNSVINNTQTGALQIYNNVDNGMIELLTDNGSGGTQVFLRADGANNMVRMPVDGVKLTLGDASDLQFYHTSNTNYIRANTTDQDLNFLVNDGGSTITAMKIDSSEVARVQFQNDNQVVAIGASDDLQFYHDGNNNVINTTKQDADLYFVVNDGGSTINAIQIDGSDVGSVYLPNDNQTLGIGAGNDLRLFHDGINSYMYNYQGELRIGNTVDNADTVFYGDDGSGGNTAYLTLDGSATQISIAKNMKFGDGVKTLFGAGEDVQLFHDSTYGGFLFNQTNHFFFDQVAADKDWIFRVDDSDGGGDYQEVMRIQGSTKNVGIGTNSPDYELDVAGDIGVDHLITHNSDSNTYVQFTSDRLRFAAGGEVLLDLFEDGTQDYVKLGDGGDVDINLNDDMFVQGSSGNVGIGTTSPEGKVHIYQSDASVAPDSDGDDLVIESNGDTGISILSGQGGGETGTLIFGHEDDANAAALQYLPAENVLSLKTQQASNTLRIATANNVEAMRIDASQNVGIGTTSPARPLHTHGTAGDTRTKTSTSNHGTYFESGVTSDSAGILLVAGHASSILNVYLQGSGGVSNEFQFQHDGDFHADGDVIAFSTTVSDKRLKDNVKTIDSALDKVMKLRGVEFDWNQGKRKGQHDLGLIAQEVEEVLPDIVREKTLCTGEYEGNEQEFKTVDYEKIVGVLIEAVKDQQKQINKLEEKLNG